MIQIPREIRDTSAFRQLKKIDRQIISAAVLMGLSNPEAFLLFHPEYAVSTGKEKYRLSSTGEVQCRNFWSYPKNREYREAYEREVAEFFGRGESAGKPAEIDDNRKDNALKALLGRAMSLVEDNSNLDPDTLKTLTEIFKKTGLLKDEVEQQEVPRRYLPVRCLQECSYRHFVESHVEGGDIVSECDYCRTRKFAEEHGWRFDATRNLELPIGDGGCGPG